jgi:DNA-binding Xre family transcriptional regulator
MFPYLFETGKNKAFEFETFEELCEILDEYEKIT